MAFKAYKSRREGFYQTGVVMLAGASSQVYLEKSLKVHEALGVIPGDYSDVNDIPQLYPAIQVKLDGLRYTTRWWPGKCQSSHPKAGCLVQSCRCLISQWPQCIAYLIEIQEQEMEKSNLWQSMWLRLTTL